MCKSMDKNAVTRDSQEPDPLFLTGTVVQDSSNQEPGDAMVARATWSPALYPGHPHGVPGLERLGLVGAAVSEAKNEPHPDPGLAGKTFGHGVIVGK